MDVARRQRDALNRLGALVEVLAQRLLLQSNYRGSASSSSSSSTSTSTALSSLEAPDACVTKSNELYHLWSLVRRQFEQHSTAANAGWDASQQSLVLSLLVAADRAAAALRAQCDGLQAHWQQKHAAIDSVPPGHALEVAELDAIRAVAIPALREEMNALTSLHRDGSLGRFEWLDGALVRALEHGHWVLLDQANLANASVLDRLNPLLEPDGVLMINECGTFCLALPI